MKKLKIWVCEDDEGVWEAQREVLEDEFPGCRLKHFENAGYAARATGSPDFILVDVGGISGFGCDVLSLARHNIEGLADLHPGAVFLVFSAIGAWAEEVYTDLKKEIKAVTCWVDGCDFYSTIGDHIRKWL